MSGWGSRRSDVDGEGSRGGGGWGGEQRPRGKGGVDDYGGGAGWDHRSGPRRGADDDDHGRGGDGPRRGVGWNAADGRGGDGRYESSEGSGCREGRNHHQGGGGGCSYRHQPDQRGGRVSLAAGPPSRDGAGVIGAHPRDAPIPRKKGRFGDAPGGGNGGPGRGNDRGDRRPDNARNDGAAARRNGPGGWGGGDRDGRGSAGWGRMDGPPHAEDGGGPSHGRTWPSNGGGDGRVGEGGGGHPQRQQDHGRQRQKDGAADRRGVAAANGGGGAAVAKKDEDDVVMVDAKISAHDEKAVTLDVRHPKDDFDSMTWRERMLSQFRFEPVVDLPEEAYNEDSEGRAARKKESAEKAIEAVMKRMHKEAVDDLECERLQREEDYDDEGGDYESDEDDVYGGRRRDRPEDRYPYSRANVERFFRAVPMCLLMTVGFDVTGVQPSHEDNCHCPCGADMVKWRIQFDIEGSIAGKEVEREYCTKGKMTPVGLMGHLRTEGNKHGGLLHHGLCVYMEHLYGKHDGSYRAGMGHKAMYFINDPNWRRAEAAANRTKEKELKRVEQLLAEEKLRTQRLEEEQRRDKEKIEFLNQVNADRGKQIQLLKDEKKTLHIESKKESSVVSKEMLKGYRMLMKTCFSMGAVASRWAIEDQTNLEIKVDQNFSLQNFLDANYRKYKRLCKQANLNDRVSMDATLLFSELHHKKRGKMLRNCHGNKILSDWNVAFQNEFKYGRTKFNREQKELDTAIDEGGPTREFLSQFFFQLGDVSFTVENEDDPVRLFEKVNNGIVPQTDDWLDAKFRGSPELKEKARVYYRAFGRLMLHALATGNTISSSAMPSFYQNWIFLGRSPEDDDYHKEDVLVHLNQQDPSFKLSTFLGQEYYYDDSTIIINEKNLFTHILPHRFIKSRKLALESIKKGLTLDGDVRVDDFFRGMPFQAFQKLVFSLPYVSTAAVIDILKPEFCVGWGDVEPRINAEDIPSLMEKQQDFFNNVLCEVLRYKECTEPTFIWKFLSFCTGYTYLPDPAGNPDFVIDVKFNFADTKPGDYPMSHSCVNELKLPGHIYPNRDDFEQKLDEAVLSSYGRFDTN